MTIYGVSLWRCIKRLAILGASGMVLLFLAGAAAHILVVSVARGRIFDQPDDLPERRTVLLLGCVKELRSGHPNPFFERRVEAVTRLYRSGQASAIVVSGDNHRRGYDEPTDMKAALVGSGVPKDRIYCDYAGFRTLDSVVRVEKVFGQNRFTIVSQRFHLERSLYLAKAYGLDAIGFKAEDVRLEWALKTYVREAFARVKAVLDVTILRTQPKFLGPPVSLEEAPQDAVTSASGSGTNR